MDGNVTRCPIGFDPYLTVDAQNMYEYSCSKFANEIAAAYLENEFGPVFIEDRISRSVPAYHPVRIEGSDVEPETPISAFRKCVPRHLQKNPAFQTLTLQLHLEIYDLDQLKPCQLELHSPNQYLETHRQQCLQLRKFTLQ